MELSLSSSGLFLHRPVIMISVILRTFINQSQNQNLESMNLILVDDCFISLILRWHLDMIVVEVDEFELVRHGAGLLLQGVRARSN